MNMSENINTEINERVKKLRKQLHLTQASFAKKINVATSTVGTWEINKRNIKPIYISAICTTFKINKEWLLFGKGEIFSNNENNPVISQIAKEYNLTKTQTNFMKAFLSLSKKQKDLIIETMEIMKSMLDTTKKEQTLIKPDTDLTIEEKRKLINEELDAEEAAATAEKKELL